MRTHIPRPALCRRGNFLAVGHQKVEGGESLATRRCSFSKEAHIGPHRLDHQSAEP